MKLLKKFSATFLLLLITGCGGGDDGGGKNCDTGKPCGDTCIARDKVCHVY
jgi:hypothetical protein